MESHDHIKIVKEGIKNYKKNEDITTRLTNLLGLLEKYPQLWLVADGGRIRGLMELAYDADRIHDSMSKDEKKNTDEVRRFYGSFLAKFDAEMRKLNASYEANDGAQQFKEEQEKKNKKSLKK